MQIIFLGADFGNDVFKTVNILKNLNKVCQNKFFQPYFTKNSDRLDSVCSEFKSPHKTNLSFF